jgi:hypothetical protein
MDEPLNDRASSSRTLERYDYYRGPRPLGDEWTLTRGSIKLRCALATHRLGWELRLTAGSNFIRSKVCKTQTDVFDTSTAWKAEAIGQGWTV